MLHVKYISIKLKKQDTQVQEELLDAIMVFCVSLFKSVSP